MMETHYYIRLWNAKYSKRLSCQPTGHKSMVSNGLDKFSVKTWMRFLKSLLLPYCLQNYACSATNLPYFRSVNPKTHSLRYLLIVDIYVDSEIDPPTLKEVIFIWRLCNLDICACFATFWIIHSTIVGLQKANFNGKLKQLNNESFLRKIFLLVIKSRTLCFDTQDYKNACCSMFVASLLDVLLHSFSGVLLRPSLWGCHINHCYIFPLVLRTSCISYVVTFLPTLESDENWRSLSLEIVHRKIVGVMSGYGYFNLTFPFTWYR